MPERKDLTTISFVTDHDTGMYYMGEIDGVFQEHSLRDYLIRYGDRGRADLLNHLAHLTFQVVDTSRKLSEEGARGRCEASS